MTPIQHILLHESEFTKSEHIIKEYVLNNLAEISSYPILTMKRLLYIIILIASSPLSLSASSPDSLKISQIARGIAIGNEIEYTDEITLGRSIVNRIEFKL